MLDASRRGHVRRHMLLDLVETGRDTGDGRNMTQEPGAQENCDKHGGEVGRKFLTYLLASFSYAVFKYSSVNPASTWDQHLVSHPRIPPLGVIGSDGSWQSAADIVEELRHTFVCKFNLNSGRVGVFVDPRSQYRNTHTSTFVQAHVPIWMDWGPADAPRSYSSGDYGGCPPVEFIPPPNAVELSQPVVAFPSRRRLPCVLTVFMVALKLILLAESLWKGGSCRRCPPLCPNRHQCPLSSGSSKVSTGTHWTATFLSAASLG
jgi:hypothetical protein